MVGVDMVLAEPVRFKHGLYKSCGIDCVEGIVLEPCLLQPCFHVAGGSGQAAPGAGAGGRPDGIYIYIYIYIYICIHIHTYACIYIYI